MYHTEGAVKLAVLDLGMTRRETRQFEALDITCQLFPLDKFAPEKMDTFSGLYISSGPEFPAALEQAALLVSPLVGKIPILGHGLGHLIIGRALGGSLSRRQVNHYGVNQPVQRVADNRCFITEQAHSLILDPHGLENQVSYLNLNDQTGEGLEDGKQKVFSFSFWPEPEHFQKFLSLLGGG